MYRMKNYKKSKICQYFHTPTLPVDIKSACNILLIRFGELDFVRTLDRVQCLVSTDCFIENGVVLQMYMYQKEINI